MSKVRFACLFFFFVALVVFDLEIPAAEGAAAAAEKKLNSIELR